MARVMGLMVGWVLEEVWSPLVPQVQHAIDSYNQCLHQRWLLSQLKLPLPEYGDRMHN